MRQLLVYRRQGNAAPYRCPVMPACAAACCWWWGGCSCRNRAALDSSNSNVAAVQPRGSLVVDDAVAAGGCRKVPPVGMHPETVVTLGWREDFSRMSPDRGCSAMNRCTLGQPSFPDTVSPRGGFRVSFSNWKIFFPLLDPSNGRLNACSLSTLRLYSPPRGLMPVNRLRSD